MSNIINKTYHFIKDKLSYHDINNDDTKRKITILKVLCIFIIFFLSLLLILSFYSSYINKEKYIGVPAAVLIVIILISLICLSFATKGRALLGSSVMILLIYICIIYGSCTWGADLPTVLIALFITVLISGILINSKVGLFCAFILSIHLWIFYYLGNDKIINLNYDWKNSTFNKIDVVEYSSLLIFAAMFSWLSNSQLEKSLRKLKNTEKVLKLERDGLDITVKERTEEIKRLQVDKINSMYRMVEFGRISSGLFHDIMSPLTNIVINIRMHKIEETERILEYLMPSIKKIDKLIQLSKKHIKIDSTYTSFDINKEILSTMEMLRYRSNKQGVKVVLIKNSVLTELYGSQILFSHIITNLLSNGLDSHDQNLIKKYNNIHKKNKVVIIKTKLKFNILHIKVIDNGCGIDNEIIKNIFEPFYTTKQEYGCGVGLSATKHILEKYFGGQINVKSKPQKGTSFSILIPLSKNNIINI